MSSRAETRDRVSTRVRALKPSETMALSARARELRARGAALALAARLAVETDEEIREGVVRALRSIGDPGAVHALAEAAAREREPDLVVAIGAAAFELAGPGQDGELRRIADALVQVIAPFATLIA